MLKRKRISSILLALVMLFSVMVALPKQASAATDFDDVEGTTFENYITYVSDKEVFEGYEDGKFLPEGNIKRGQVAAVLARAKGLTSAVASDFSDVSEDHIFTKDIAAVAKAGIFEGYEDETFKPEALITRGQAAKVIAIAYDYKEVDGEALEFEDVEDDNIFKPYIDALTSNGVLSGFEGKFMPEDNVTRGQFAKYLAAPLGYVEPVDEFKVLSVSAINGLELQVTFSKPVDKTDAELTNGNDKVSLVGNTSASTPTAWGGNFTKAELSEDGKVLTLTADKAIDVKDATLTVKPVKSADDATVTSEKYVSLFTYKDTVAPSVVKVEAEGTEAEITFNEEVTVTGISSNGKNLASADYTITGKVLTMTGLTAEETYTVEIVGAKDTAGNIADPINLTFTVAKPGEALQQGVAISASGSNVTLTFVNPITSSSGETVDFDPADFAFSGPIPLNATDTTGITYSNDDKTVVLDAQLLNVFGNTDTLTTKVTVGLGGTLDPVEKTVTLTKDTVAPKFVSSEAKNTTDDGKTLQLNFDKAVGEPANIAFKITHKDGVRQGSPTTVTESKVAYATDAAGDEVKTSLVVTLADVAFVAGDTYTVEVAEGQVDDVYGNDVAKFTTTFTIPQVDAVDETAIITVTDPGAATLESDGTQTITLAFNNATDDLTDASASAANFTLGGKALPTGSVVEFINNKKTILITLPAGSVVTTGTDYRLTLANIADLDGNTLEDGEEVQYVDLTENVAPTVKSVKAASERTIEVTFSEDVKKLDTTDITVLVNGKEVAIGSAPAISGDTLTITLSDKETVPGTKDVADLALGDKISVEFENSTITDDNGNPFADVTVTN